MEKCLLRNQPLTNPLLSYLHHLSPTHCSPKSFGLVHRKHPDQINISSFYLREAYVDAFAEGIHLSEHIQVLNLSRNHLNTDRFIRILRKLPKSLKELNIGNNPQIQTEGFKVLAEQVLDEPKYKLERLVVEGCRINDQTVSILAKSVEYNNTLKFLDLSHNHIREQGALHIANMVANNFCLVVLFLHWNHLQAKGGSYIA